MKEKKIIKAFEKGKSVHKWIGVLYDDGTTGELCGYYCGIGKSPQFYFEEFEGLTRKEAMKICKEKYNLY